MKTLFSAAALLLVLLAPEIAMAQEAETTLMRAYKREFAFLEAEKAALETRLTALEQRGKARVGAIKREIHGLQGRVTGLTLEADGLADTLNAVDEKVDGLSEGDDVLTGLVTQASNALKKGNLTLPAAAEGDATARLKQVTAAFEQATGLLGQYGQVRRAPGKFFGADGVLVEGQIIQVGNIASYGQSASASGALAPAGEGRLKLWPQGDSAAVAQALAAGKRPANLEMFIYENLDRGVEPRKEKTAHEVIESGGVIAWVIVGAGVLAILMIILRTFLLAKANRGGKRLLNAIGPLVESGRVDEALTQCQAQRGASSRVMQSTLRHLGKPREELENVVAEAVLHESPTLDRFGAAILVLAAVAPLLGLLGTVTGMISTFDVITEFGTGNPKLLSGGISEALVTTELGLIVAIPALLFGNLLTGWSESIKDNMDKSALRIINLSTGISLASVEPANADTDNIEAPEPVQQQHPTAHVAAEAS